MFTTTDLLKTIKTQREQIEQLLSMNKSWIKLCDELVEDNERLEAQLASQTTSESYSPRKRRTVNELAQQRAKRNKRVS